MPVTAIEDGAFSGAGLTAVAQVSPDTFSGCGQLRTVNFYGPGAVYATFEGLLYASDMAKLVYAPPALTGGVTVHVDAPSIGDYALRGACLIRCESAARSPKSEKARSVKCPTSGG